MGSQHAKAKKRARTAPGARERIARRESKGDRIKEKTTPEENQRQAKLLLPSTLVLQCVTSSQL